MLGVGRPRGRPSHPDVLTPAEWRVADLVRHGMSRRQIASRRDVSLDAVRYHLGNISRKVSVGGVSALRHWPGIPASQSGTAVPAATVQEGSMFTSTQLTAVGQIALLVTDVEEAERFYRDVLELRHLYTFDDLTFFDCGGTRLFLRAVRPDDWAAGSIVYFQVADLHAAHDRLAAAAVGFQGAPHMIHRHEDGTEEWMAFFTDPAGNVLALMSQHGASPQRR